MYNYILEVPYTSNKLLLAGSRSPVRVNEINYDLLRDFIDLYCPLGGTVVEFNAGSMSVCLASMLMSRKCISVESDKHCHKFSIDRLQAVAASKI